MIWVLLACQPATTNYSGTAMSAYFPMDGSRIATFNNEDTEITWQLEVAKQLQTAQKDGREVVTFDYANAETGDLLGTVSWSSVKGDEVLVHAYSLGAGASVTFDPPVMITEIDDAMSPGDVVESESTDSDGTKWTFTTTFVESYPECPTTYSDDFTKCAHFTISAGDVDPAAAPLFVGDHVLVATLGPAFITIPGWETEWELTSFTFESSE